MQTFRHFIIEKSGLKPGKMELSKTSVDKAYEWLDIRFKKNGLDIDQELPRFKTVYSYVQKIVSTGWTLRKNMPVIRSGQVRDFQSRLAAGSLDIKRPFGTLTDTSNPFPTGLTAKNAKEFMVAGLVQYDGSQKDDQIKISQTKIQVDKLKPIQKQIYFDNAMGYIVKSGRQQQVNFVGSTFFIVSSDNHIIDGHHRYLTAMLLDPKMSVNIVKIDLPIKILLAVTLAYGDAMGNKRNR